MSKYKIVINGRFLTQRLTGVQRYAYELVNKMLEQGSDLVVAVPPGELFKGYKIDGWPITRTGRLNGHLWEQLSLPIFIRSQKKKWGNYILVNFCNAAPIVISNKIVALHDLAFIENPAWFKKSFALYYRKMIPAMLRKCLAVITVSEFSKNEIEKHYSFTKGKVYVIHSSPASATRENFSDSPDILKRFGLEERQYFLSVSSLEPRKNLATLIKAFGRLNNKTVRLVLIGKKERSFSAISFDDDPLVVFPGYLQDSEVNTFYRNAACFVYPSLYEGFGLPPIEAMVNECPVIASAIPSHNEICADGALYVNPYDADDITAKMDLIISDPALQDKVREKGIIRSKFFNWDKSVYQLKELIYKLKGQQ